jgi:hypothetical protein
MKKQLREINNNSLSESTFNGSILENVSIMGSRRSKNGYTYSQKAMEDICAQSDGCKVFINHESRSERSDRDGVRSVADWAGVLSHPNFDGFKIKGNLIVREAYRSLFEDIKRLSPSGMGLSISAMVRMSDDETIVESCSKLNSVDLVANAACNTTLSESIKESINRNKNELLESLYAEDEKADETDIDRLIESIRDNSDVKNY